MQLNGQARSAGYQRVHYFDHFGGLGPKPLIISYLDFLRYGTRAPNWRDPAPPFSCLQPTSQVDPKIHGMGGSIRNLNKSQRVQIPSSQGLRPQKP